MSCSGKLSITKGHESRANDCSSTFDEGCEQARARHLVESLSRPEQSLSASLRVQPVKPKFNVPTPPRVLRANLLALPQLTEDILAHING